MNKAGFLFLGAVMSMGSLLVASTGCGDDGSGGSGGSGGGDTASSSSSKAASSSASASSSSGGGGVKLDCDSYCTQVQANCTGDNAQWGAVESCKAACATFAPGTLADMSGNTLGCRIYHSGAPAKMTPAMHCSHSGLVGGDVDPAATGMGKDGPCGDGVEAFCKAAIATCKGADLVWADVAACTADAIKFKAGTTPFSTKETMGDTFNCRAYHLTVAAKDATSATMHCPHIKLVSDACKP